MNVVVIGLGSMGKRRCRLLKQIDLVSNIYGVDTNANRQNQVENDMQLKCYSSLKEVCDLHQIDAVVISTSPLSHSKIIKECLEFNLHVFTEINLVSDMYQEIMSLAKEKERVLFLSSTFLYRNEISYLAKRVLDKKVNYVYHTGQYLPDWHPWENIKDFFVGDSRTNGCREIFAIELPWILNVFGDVESIVFDKRKSSSLDINYNDTYMVLLRHKNGTLGTIIVDVISREATRNLEVFGEQIHLHWNGKPTGLWEYDFNNKSNVEIKVYKSYDQDSNYAANIIETAYKEELINYLDCIEKKDVPKYSFEKDNEVLKLIDLIEEKEVQ